MINRNDSTLKTLTPAQRAKARKLIAQFEAERDPIMWQKNELEMDIRRQAYVDMNIAELCHDVEKKFTPEIEELTAQINKLCDARAWLQDEKRKSFEDIKMKPYLVAGNHPKVMILREMWGDVETRYSEKMTALLESFKNVEVA